MRTRGPVCSPRLRIPPGAIGDLVLRVGQHLRLDHVHDLSIVAGVLLQLRDRGNRNSLVVKQVLIFRKFLKLLFALSCHFNVAFVLT